MVSNGISKLDLKRRNRMQILRLLRRNGPTSRIDIAREIGITKAAVTIITNEMIQDHILYEKGEQHDPDARVTRGRKKILLDICATYKMDLGMVLEGRNLYAGVSTLWGDIVEKQTVRIEPGASREEILGRMEELYRQLLYKNDLTPEKITGLGVCIDPRYYETLRISAKQGLDYQEFRKELEKFVQVPMAFGTLTEGAAMAEMDYWQQNTTPADELVIMRCDGNPEAATVIEQEIYRGASGQAMRVPPEARQDSEKILWSKLTEIFSEQKTPELWKLTKGNLECAKTLLREGRAVQCDPSVETLVEDLIIKRAQSIRLIAYIVDPGKLLLLAAHAEERWFAEMLQAQLQAVLPEYPVSLSLLEEDCIFLAGAALATREFFGNRGGY